jgi:hypothetical protein
MKTEILFIMDRSGSMGSCAADAVGGFNQFLKDQKKKPKGKRLSLFQFDDQFEYTYKSEKLKNCKPLVLGKTYVPRGMTALVDAVGGSINALKAKKAIVAIYTDGFENASKEYTYDDIEKLIKKKRKKDWEVIFLASDMSKEQAMGIAGSMGISMTKTAVVGKSAQAYGASMGTIARAANNYAASGKASDLNIQDEYDKKMKETGEDTSQEATTS